MPAYHSSFLDGKDPTVIAGVAALQYKKGHSSHPNIDNLSEDIIEEAINLFRPNVFAKSFEIRGPADRTLVYLLLYISDCLGRLKTEMSLTEAQKTLSLASAQSLVLPGEAGFPLNGMFPAVGRDADQLRAYLTGLRGETAVRLLARVYAQDAVKPSIWWMAFQRRKFMNKSL